MTCRRSAYQPPPDPSQPPLPPGWTEHNAPTGHTYYYNAETKHSTYTRPSAPPPIAAPPPPPGDVTPLATPTPTSAFNGFQHPQPLYPNHLAFNPFPSAISDRPTSTPNNQRRCPPPDRPKSKHDIPGGAPWVLVKTRLGRRFVHNTETSESLWRIPDYLKAGIEQFDEQEKKRREGDTGANAVAVDDRASKPVEPLKDGEDDAQDDKPSDQVKIAKFPVDEQGEDLYDEIIEEEVSDYGASPPHSPNPDGPNKRQRLDNANDPDNPDDDNKNDQDPPDLEFTEADIAAQLEAMGQSYNLDPSDYAHPTAQNDDDDDDDDDNINNNNSDDNLDLTPAESQTLFHSLLTDHATNPYTTWEALITSPAADALIADDRYTLLPNMRSRKASFLLWSERTITAQRSRDAQHARQDPRVAYLDLLSREASPKLYWPEFRKRFRKEPVMGSTKLSDKEKERLYRDFVARLKSKDSETRKDELWGFLKTVKVGQEWNGHTRVEDVPDGVRGDVRWAVVKVSSRERLVKDFLKRLPLVDELDEDGVGGGMSEEKLRERRENRKKEAALRARETTVLAQKRRAAREKHLQREGFLAEEEELRRAQAVDRSGLRAQLDK